RRGVRVAGLPRGVARMVNVGIFPRRRAAFNNREVTVRLAPKGAASLAGIIPHAIELERRAISGVPAEDLNVVRRSLRRMYQNLAASGWLSRTTEAPPLRASAASAASSRHRPGGRTRR